VLVLECPEKVLEVPICRRMASNPNYFVYDLYAICSLVADITVHLD